MKELPGKFFRASDYAPQKRNHYVLLAPIGVTPDDLVRPTFYRNHVNTLLPLDLIEVIAEDGSFEMTLRVRGYLTSRNGDDARESRQGVIVRELDRKIFGELATQPVAVEKEEPEQIGDLTITWGGPAHKFRILDGIRLVSKGHKTREDAQEAAQAYLDKLKAA